MMLALVPCTLYAPTRLSRTVGWDAAGNTGPADRGIGVDLTKATAYAGFTTVAVDGQNGQTDRTLEPFSISNDGTILGAFSNGTKQAVGEVAMARFTNPGSLEKAGNSAYSPLASSGASVLGAGGYGSISSGFLEMSNVDLSQEFTNLIVAQRGFQSNARSITTSDQVLQELIDLKGQIFSHS